MMKMASIHEHHGGALRSLTRMNTINARPSTHQPTTTSTRKQVGEVIAPVTLQTLNHGPLELPGAGLVHLQFRRFAGCPVCNLHLQSFVRGLPLLQAAGVTTVAFFHSSAESMQPFQGDLPFPTVPDLERRWYAHFGVEQSLWAVAHPRVMAAALRGLFTAPSSPFVGEGGQQGLPADFLLDAQGVVRAVKYGAHANDQWEVNDVVALAAAAR